jgi:hypothetical protein
LWFRSISPDVATVQEVLKQLPDNNIDIRHLAEMTADHCQQAEKSTKEEILV